MIDILCLFPPKTKYLLYKADRFLHFFFSIPLLHFTVLSMVLSGLCAFTIYLVSSSLANLLVSCAFGLVSIMGFNSLDCLGIELFPTHLR